MLLLHGCIVEDPVACPLPHDRCPTTFNGPAAHAHDSGILRAASQGPCTAIHHPDSVLDGMNDWCKEHHGKSGLTQRVRDSTVSMAEAEEALLDFISRHTEEGMAQLAGNSVHVGWGRVGAWGL